MSPVQQSARLRPKTVDIADRYTACVNGQKLRELREYHGLTQSQVARAAGVSQSIVSDVERGRRLSPEAIEQVVGGLRRSMSPSLAVARHGTAMRAFLEANGARDVRVFGSTARGADRWDSDLDIVARFDRPMSLFDVDSLVSALRRIAGGLPVDLVVETDRTRLRDLHAVPM